MSKFYTPVSPEEAVKVIKSGDRVHLHGVACTPHILINAMVARAPELREVYIQHIHTEGPAPYADPQYEGIFCLESFFVGENVREVTQEGYADYIPVFLSETQKMMREDILHVNVAMVQISPPDRFGYVSLGSSVEATRAAVQCADTVIAVVNPNVPRAWGDAMMHIRNFDIFVEDNSPLVEAPAAQPDEKDKIIGRYIAELVEDGATLQMGIGSIPNAVLSNLTNHRRLGVHTEMFSDGLIPLVESGVITGEEKTIDRDKIVASFLMGTKKTYDFINDNPAVAMMDVAHTNNIALIAMNPKVTAINAAIQIDITGQVCADSIGTKFYSGVGGQIDFIRGATRSKGGKPIIAMHSVTNKGVSKIAPTLLLGAGVVTTRASVHYVITEQGIADLYGKSLQKRARALINVAHPDHREMLEKAAFERYGKHFLYSK